MVRPILSVRCLSCLSVCHSVLSVRLIVLWQNGWMDYEFTMSLGTEVGLGPGHIVLDGDTALPHGRGTAAHAPTFRPISLWQGRPSHQLLSSCCNLMHQTRYCVSRLLGSRLTLNDGRRRHFRFYRTPRCANGGIKVK